MKYFSSTSSFLHSQYKPPIASADDLWKDDCPSCIWRRNSYCWLRNCSHTQGSTLPAKAFFLCTCAHCIVSCANVCPLTVSSLWPIYVQQDSQVPLGYKMKDFCFLLPGLSLCIHSLLSLSCILFMSFLFVSKLEQPWNKLNLRILQSWQASNSVSSLYPSMEERTSGRSPECTSQMVS